MLRCINHRGFRPAVAIYMAVPVAHIFHDSRCIILGKPRAFQRPKYAVHNVEVAQRREVLAVKACIYLRREATATHHGQNTSHRQPQIPQRVGDS